LIFFAGIYLFVFCKAGKKIIWGAKGGFRTFLLDTDESCRVRQLSLIENDSEE